MKIKLKGTYKSLTDFESDELNDLTVITGKNGTGKTHFLNAIKNFYPPHKGNDNKNTNYTIEIDEPIKKIQFEGLKRNGFSTVTNKISNDKINTYIQKFNGVTQKVKALLAFMYDNDFTLEDLKSGNSEVLNDLYNGNLSILLNDILKEKEFTGHLATENDYIYSKVKTALKEYVAVIELLLLVKKYKATNFVEIDSQSFYSIPIPEHFLDNDDLFESQLETIFYSYSRKRFYNDYYFYRQTQGDNNLAIEDSEFIKKFIPPWDQINKILKSHGISLSFKEVDFKNFIEPNHSVDVIIEKAGIEKKLAIEDLSSGEQIILGLILKLFASDYYETLSFPDLILLDEPDAYLHPEMSHLLINVLHKTFVLKLKIKVIITTHSPSTIALTPEECIFEMNNDPCQLKKITKDSALNILTGNIPTLSIDYTNHRQIFVESQTDIGYYQRLFGKISNIDTVKHKLYFISNGKGKGNNVWVKDIVGKLRDSGSNKVFGIIDWDAKNPPTEFVFVHGLDTTYSIENFLLDGIYLCILLMELDAHNIKTDLSFSETDIEYGIINEGQERLQEIWNWIINKIIVKYPKLNNHPTKQVQYYNDIIISVPEWYLTTKGHELELKIKEAFPALSKFKNEGDLQDKLSIIMAKCYPLVPNESILLLKKLSS